MPLTILIRIRLLTSIDLDPIFAYTGLSPVNERQVIINSTTYCIMWARVVLPSLRTNHSRVLTSIQHRVFANRQQRPTVLGETDRPAENYTPLESVCYMWFVHIGVSIVLKRPSIGRSIHHTSRPCALSVVHSSDSSMKPSSISSRRLKDLRQNHYSGHSWTGVRNSLSANKWFGKAARLRTSRLKSERLNGTLRTRRYRKKTTPARGDLR